MANVQRGYLDLRSVSLIDATEEEIAELRLQPGDILLNEGGDRDKLGRGWVWNGEIPECIHQNHVFRARLRSPEIDPRFVSYYANALGQSYFMGEGKQTTNPASINLTKLGLFPVPLPPLCEQRRIVAKIEELLSELDAAIAALERVRVGLKRYRAAVLKAAVEGKLTEEWRSQHPGIDPASELLRRILAERHRAWEEAELARYAKAGKMPPKGWQAKYKEAATPDASEQPELPEGWCWAALGQLAAAEATAITDGPFGSSLKTEHYTGSGPRVIRLQNIGDGVFRDEVAHIPQAHFDGLRKHRVFSGDLVIAALGENPPRSCLLPDFVGPAIVKADCVRFKPSPHLLGAFLNFALNAEPTRKRTAALLHGVGRPRLNLGEIKSITVPLPPAEEQRQIIAEVEQQLGAAAEAEVQVEAGLKRAAQLRQSILARAFAGKLVLPEAGGLGARDDVALPQASGKALGDSPLRQLQLPLE